MAGSFCGKCGTPAAAQAQGATAGSGGGAAAGLADNAASALCYLLGLITGVIFLMMTPYNQKESIRFHAWQSILLSLAWLAFWIAMGMLTAALSFFGLLLVPIQMLIGLAGFLYWLFLMWKAYQGERIRIPVISDFAAKQAAAA
jgi:uncharacterized membrane protein